MRASKFSDAQKAFIPKQGADGIAVAEICRRAGISQAIYNRAENSHQPTRRSLRIMERFMSAGQAQRFLSVHDQVANLFRRPANTNAADHRKARAQAFTTWADVTSVAAAC